MSITANPFITSQQTLFKVTDPSYPAFPILSFLSCIIIVIPLKWHWQAWNSGTCLFMIWTAVGLLNMFVNSIIWHKNVVDWAPIWCDISTRIIIGVSVAIPATSLCINRRLHAIATCQTVSLSKGERRKSVYIDVLIGVGIPVLQMILQFVVQGHRYDIYEDIGCFPTSVNTALAYPLSYVWSNVLSLTSATYGVLTLRAFLVRRAQFSQLLTRNPNLSMSRYFRLMALAAVEICISVPICTFTLVYNVVTRPVVPYTSWSDIHADFFIIGHYPAVFWRSTVASEASLEITRWSLVICALVFFAFFGFADEARKNYRSALAAISRVLGCKVIPSFKSLRSKTKKASSPATLPIHEVKSFPELAASVPSTTSHLETDILSPCSTSTDYSLNDSITLAPSSPPAYCKHKLESTLSASDSSSSRLSQSTI
uniref:Putative transmembrane pheromone receptor n=2 Tax=Coprinellus disseminatus TaxID=71703 RepID=Q1WMU3_COPDI|nr:putative transmembrane pheromone receptor [Coprinellus disseminatus]